MKNTSTEALMQNCKNADNRFNLCFFLVFSSVYLAVEAMNTIRNAYNISDVNYASEVRDKIIKPQTSKKQT